MDILILQAIAIALLGIMVTLLFLKNKINQQVEEKQPQQQQRSVPQRVEEGVPIRAQIVRQHDSDDDQADNDQAEIPQRQVLDEKIEAELKRLVREQDMKQRKDRKVQMRAEEHAKMVFKEQKRLREPEKQQEYLKSKEAKQENERKKLVECKAQKKREQTEIERLAREEQKRIEDVDCFFTEYEFTQSYYNYCLWDIDHLSDGECDIIY